ncbi:unnamed protein product [Zymoseptoria tritici ST99CH_1A5]|uniref:Uncharacterized protein n=1 Tax=Zymoseptoria tritici ST99CH_1A5 TaxID=1276529 RepID=A0A1Y6M1N8_ZYMTR|nr:unnamed protein product [Zymoseptoria tritici ST99CH_1A5]
MGKVVHTPRAPTIQDKINALPFEVDFDISQPQPNATAHLPIKSHGGAMWHEAFLSFPIVQMAFEQPGFVLSQPTMLRNVLFHLNRGSRTSPNDPKDTENLRIRMKQPGQSITLGSLRAVLKDLDDGMSGTDTAQQFVYDLPLRQHRPGRPLEMRWEQVLEHQIMSIVKCPVCRKDNGYDDGMDEEVPSDPLTGLALAPSIEGNATRVESRPSQMLMHGHLNHNFIHAMMPRGSNHEFKKTLQRSYTYAAHGCEGHRRSYGDREEDEWHPRFRWWGLLRNSHDDVDAIYHPTIFPEDDPSLTVGNDHSHSPSPPRIPTAAEKHPAPPADTGVPESPPLEPAQSAEPADTGVIPPHLRTQAAQEPPRPASPSQDPPIDLGPPAPAMAANGPPVVTAAPRAPRPAPPMVPAPAAPTVVGPTQSITTLSTLQRICSLNLNNRGILLPGYCRKTAGPSMCGAPLHICPDFWSSVVKGTPPCTVTGPDGTQHIDNDRVLVIHERVTCRHWLEGTFLALAGRIYEHGIRW